jgi:hypothetical protein
MSAKAFNDETSPKAALLLANLADAPGPALVYSQFVDAGGLAVISRFLQNAGYSAYRPPAEPQLRMHYSVISGDVQPKDRVKIQEVFNSPENAHGGVIKVLLVSKTGAEGLDLKGVRQVHIFEPYWDKSREDQVKARGIRLGSHAHLPAGERNVQPFIYIATANSEVVANMQPAAAGRPRNTLEDQTIDERFHERALTKHALNLAFRKLLQDVSLECAVNGYGGCRLCVPTDAPLFHEDPLRDLRLPDPCQPLEEAQIEVEEIFLPGEDTPYFYRKDPVAPLGVRFFEFNENLNSYAPVDESTGLFMRLHEALEGQSHLERTRD